MKRDITKLEAMRICGQIRRRKTKVCLFRTNHGFKLSPAHRTTDQVIGSQDFIGLYDKRVNYERIHEDWNDTI